MGVAVGNGVAIARGAAACIKLDAGIILITVLRNMISVLRRAPFAKYLPLEKNIVFHKGTAWIVAFLAAMHTCAHYINYLSLAAITRGDSQGRAGDPSVTIEDVNAALTQLRRDVMNYQPFPTDNTQPTDFAFGTPTGLTGHIVVMIMVLMYTSAIVSIRRPMFEVFW